MKAHKLTLLIVDHDDVEEEIPNILENEKYPNYCISPHVMSMETVDIGEWSDDHPFNKLDQMKNHFDQIFDGRQVSDDLKLKKQLEMYATKLKQLESRLEQAEIVSGSMTDNTIKVKFKNPDSVGGIRLRSTVNVIVDRK